MNERVCQAIQNEELSFLLFLYSLAYPFLRLIKFYHLHFDMLLKSRNFALQKTQHTRNYKFNHTNTK